MERTILVILAGLAACGGDEDEGPSPDDDADADSDADTDADADADADSDADADADGYAPHQVFDVNADGVADLLAGVRGDPVNPGGAALALQPAGARAAGGIGDVYLTDEFPAFAFRARVAGGDLDGDGYDDIVAVADPFVLYVVRGGPSLPPEIALATDADATLLQANSAVIADVDGDGVEDLLVGSDAVDCAPDVDCGRIALYRGGADVLDRIDAGTPDASVWGEPGGLLGSSIDLVHLGGELRLVASSELRGYTVVVPLPLAGDVSAADALVRLVPGRAEYGLGGAIATGWIDEDEEEDLCLGSLSDTVSCWSGAAMLGARTIGPLVLETTASTTFQGEPGTGTGYSVGILDRELATPSSPFAPAVVVVGMGRSSWIESYGYSYGYFGDRTDLNPLTALVQGEVVTLYGPYGPPTSDLVVEACDSLNEVDPDLAAPKTHEVILALTQQIGADLVVPLEGTWRRRLDAAWNLPIVVDDLFCSGPALAPYEPAP